ncbi:MAG TPA: hypothetical protein VHM27_00275, partial [Rhizomicrobium sp.]|nr:hypothetical protein [Rhizomicrobium sp.]
MRIVPLTLAASATAAPAKIASTKITTPAEAAASTEITASAKISTSAEALASVAEIAASAEIAAITIITAAIRSTEIAAFGWGRRNGRRRLIIAALAGAVEIVPARRGTQYPSGARIGIEPF